LLAIVTIVLVAGAVDRGAERLRFVVAAIGAAGAGSAGVTGTVALVARDQVVGCCGADSLPGICVGGTFDRVFMGVDEEGVSVIGINEGKRIQTRSCELGIQDHMMLKMVTKHNYNVVYTAYLAQLDRVNSPSTRADGSNPSVSNIFGCA
jgi:hypothetical protein